MSNKLIQQLEQIAAEEKFVLIDTCSLIYQDSEQKGILRCIHSMQKITQVPTELLENTIAFHQTLQDIFCKENTHVTKEVFAEVERGMKFAKDRIKGIQHKKEFDKNKTTDDPTKKYANLLADNLLDELERAKQTITTKTLKFYDNTSYDRLFELFKQIAPFTNDKKERATKHKYLFGDESISAAVMYLILCEEKKTPVTVVSRDFDIMRVLRTAYHLFSTIDPEKFAKKIITTPFKTYLPLTKNNEYKYHTTLNTIEQKTMGTIEKERICPEKFNAMLEIAYDTFHRIC